MHTFPDLDLNWDPPVDSPISPVISEPGLKLDETQDFVSRKRRHAIYFHRPPVWQYSVCQSGSSSTNTTENIACGLDDASEGNLSFCSVGWPQEPNLCDNMNFQACLPPSASGCDLQMSLLESETTHSQLTLPDGPSTWLELPQDPLRQTKPVFCTRLQSCKDVRLGLGEQWAIQEGSLVIGIDPSYTLLNQHERRSDEFEVVGGDLFIVCCLYADLWALCAKASSFATPDSDDNLHLAFIPLCAVTLAANFGAFVRRSSRYPVYPLSLGPRYPGSGLPVMPPLRSHSLNASKQMFLGHTTRMSLPLAARDVFQNLSLKRTDTDFEPLDSTLEPILSRMTSRRRRLLRSLEAGGSFLRFRASTKREVTLDSSNRKSASLPSYRRRRGGSMGDRRRHVRKGRQSSSGASSTFRWLTRKSW